MTIYLIAVALVSLVIGFSLAAYLYGKMLESADDNWSSICDRLRERNRIQSDAFNHVLKQRNDLQNKLNELTK